MTVLSQITNPADLKSSKPYLKQIVQALLDEARQRD